MMGKILKQIPYPLNFIKLKNLNKNMKYSQVPIRLKWNLMTDLNSNILLENKDVGAFTLLCSSQPLCNHFSRGTEHIMKRVALDSLPALSLLKHSYFFWAQFCWVVQSSSSVMFRLLILVLKKFMYVSLFLEKMKGLI